MGLDTTHDCWHGSYSGFAQFRQRIANAAGIVGYGEPGGIDWDWLASLGNQPGRHGYPSTVYEGHWNTLPEDPIWILLAHSDCDGEIPHELTGVLADRLEELEIGAWGYGQQLLDRFITGLRDAQEKGEAVGFH